MGFNDFRLMFPPDDVAEVSEFWHALQDGMEAIDGQFELRNALLAHPWSAAATDKMEID